MFLDAYEAILKGVLESQVPVSVVAAPRRAPFERLQRVANEPEHARVLARHQVELLVGGDAARAISLACACVRGGRSAVALVPNDELVRGADAVLRASDSFVEFLDAALAASHSARVFRRLNQPISLRFAAASNGHCDFHAPQESQSRSSCIARCCKARTRSKRGPTACQEALMS